jgi:hypothetical protein
MIILVSATMAEEDGGEEQEIVYHFSKILYEYCPWSIRMMLQQYG